MCRKKKWHQNKQHSFIHLASRKPLHTQVDIPTASFMAATCPINNSHPAEEKDGEWSVRLVDRSTDSPGWSSKINKTLQVVNVPFCELFFYFSFYARLSDTEWMWMLGGHRDVDILYRKRNLPGLGNANGGQAHNSIRNLQWSEYRKSKFPDIKTTVRGFLGFVHFISFHLFLFCCFSIFVDFCWSLHFCFIFWPKEAGSLGAVTQTVCDWNSARFWGFINKNNKNKKSDGQRKENQNRLLEKKIIKIIEKI